MVVEQCGCQVSISKNDPRAEIWKEVFGKYTFPITYPLYFENPNFPGKRFLNGDGRRLDDLQKTLMAILLSKKFGIPESEILENLKTPTIPILDENVTVLFCSKHSRMLMY